MSAESWMNFAIGEVGNHEISGSQDCPRIIEYLETTRLPESMHHDETPWCSAFTNWVFKQVRIDGTHSAAARSWLKWGIKLDEPKFGCVVVLSRPTQTPGSGHVAFYVGAYKDKIMLLGGNQGNAVSQRLYPSRRVIGYRWPEKIPEIQFIEEDVEDVDANC